MQNEIDKIKGIEGVKFQGFVPGKIYRHNSDSQIHFTYIELTRDWISAIAEDCIPSPMTRATVNYHTV
jgi:hypothetical protein